mmetsp:Transcript_71271/g.225151  ORF Transcript_71271/g.225151 Transcript_71271/m.225151 type:complete len:110 (+) Transcript_71271:181-510(+)
MPGLPHSDSSELPSDISWRSFSSAASILTLLFMTYIGSACQVAANDAAIQEESSCRSCGCHLRAKMLFCPQCGTKRADAPRPKTCAECGSKLPRDSNFCPRCGAKRPAD